MEDSRKAYVVRGLCFALLMAIGIIVFYNRMAGNSEAYDAWKGYWVGAVTAVVFLGWQAISLYREYNMPEEKAEPIKRKDNARNWARQIALSFGGVLMSVALLTAGSEGLDTVINNLFAVVLGSGLWGGLVYFVSLPFAFVLSPKEYKPWRTEEGYQAYQRREEQRRREAAAKAAYLAQHMQNTTSYTSPTSAVPGQSIAPVSDVRGRIYRGQFSGTEIGYYTGDSIYKKGDFLTDAKVGKYSSGRIDDDSGIWSMNTVGRYEWSSTYGGYLIYAGDARKEFVGRVCRNGDIQAAKQPHGVTEIVLSGVEYTTIGRFTGDPEGAAAAAYLLLFR